ncbi:heavy metal translocatin [Flagelloscypha sp. PMI_526]|nr:heavy metal translocatin [Flagelloscypha sp. PMI_526]
MSSNTKTQSAPVLPTRRRYPSGMETPLAKSMATVALVSNMHCSSCVATIEGVLNTLSPRPLAVEISIVLGQVTVWHSESISPKSIRQRILEAGFDVAGPSSDTVDSTVPLYVHGSKEQHMEQCEMCRASFEGRSPPPEKHPLEASDHQAHHVQLSVAGMTCSACTNTITAVLQNMEGVSDVQVNLLDNSASATIQSEALANTLQEAIDDAGYTAQIVALEPIAAADTQYIATLSIGGMTCSACVHTLSDLLAKVDGVTQVKVSLVDNSATLILENSKVADTLTEVVENAGYDCTIASLEPFVEPSTSVVTKRTVPILVEGMFCRHCPDKIKSALKSSFPTVEVVKDFPSRGDPVITISYTPDLPSISIRQVLEVVAASNSPPFKVSVYHPPTIDDLAYQIRRRERKHYLLRLILAIVLAIPTFIIGIVYMTLVPEDNPGRGFIMHPIWAGNVPRAQWALLFISTPAMFCCADVFHRRCFKEIRALWRPGSRVSIVHRLTRFGSMNMLISMGVSIAYLASIALLILASQEEPMAMGSDSTYFDSVVFLVMFLLAGRFIESHSKAQTATAINALSALRPATALLLAPVSASTSSITESIRSSADVEKGNVEAEKKDSSTGISAREISVDLLEIGDVVRVPHGSTPPADGTVVAGNGLAFDESSLTGEAKLVTKNLGDEVYLGSINKGGLVHVRVDKVEGGTFLDGVLKVVREGQMLRAPIERVADTITAYFVPVITLIAILTWVIWLCLGYSGALPPDYLDISVGGYAVWSLRFSIAVFIVACPCGIGLAAPTALLVGSGLAAKYGILSRGGGEAFQEMSQVNTIVFDKTGTLTKGTPKVTKVQVAEDSKYSQDLLFSVAFELESSSSHPLASAICAHTKSETDSKSVVAEEVEEIPGRGMRGRFNHHGYEALLGNESLMTEQTAIYAPGLKSIVTDWKARSQTIVLLALRSLDDEDASFVVSAVFSIADEIRDEAKQVIEWLRSEGIEPWLVSGDPSIETVRSVAAQTGIPQDNIMSGVMPQEKAKKIAELQNIGAKRRIVGMVGDGINDSPALAAADVGIAIGSGSDVAISSASFILLHSDLRSLSTLMSLSRKVIQRVKLNFGWALVYNMAAVPIAAGVIYPYHHARLDPVWASLAMALSSVSVVLSSLALRLYKPPVAA